MLRWMVKVVGWASGLPWEMSAKERHDRFMRRCMGAPDDMPFPRDGEGRFAVVVKQRRDNAKAVP